MDAFAGVPVWHVSVSVASIDGLVIPTAELRPKWTRRAQQLCYELLDGVGQAPDRRDRLAIAYHLRRRVTERELRLIERLSPGWCAIPAEHMAGGGEPW